MKKGLLISCAALGLASTLLLSSCGKSEEYDVIATSFAGYDFARAVAKENLSCSMLLNPDTDLHEYSPSPRDILSIKKSKVFIYIGGESDEEWVESQILPQIDSNKTTVINMMEVVEEKGGNQYEEEDPSSFEPEGIDSNASFAKQIHDDEEEYDEHIWNSLTNAKLIIEEISSVFKAIDEKNKESYETNKEDYIEKINEVDNNIKDVIKTSSKDLIVFADKFPLLYFVKEYGLQYDAAFKGCDSSNSASATTIIKLANKVCENDLNTIFVIELSKNQSIANSVKSKVQEKGKDVEIRTFYTMHNVSKDDLDKGTTYVDFMNKNVESLNIALN